MSTLKVNNLQDINGANNSTPEQVAQGRAKAWVDFNGTGTLAIRDSFNVSSVTDVGTGNYTVNFPNSFPNAHYAFFASASNEANFPNYATPMTKNANNVNFRTGNDLSTSVDSSLSSVVIFAD
tara:strand:- start:78 stop:446 length:369 start_codon:yes stop_codon:yes gene_type:complete